MSAYVVDNKTITCIAKAFVDYGVEFSDGKPHTIQIIVDLNKMVQDIGQALLKANYDSVNARYGEDTECPAFEIAEIGSYNEGTVFGCIDCFEYQACEVDDWDTSPIKASLDRLERKITERLIHKAGYEISWGYTDEE